MDMRGGATGRDIARPTTHPILGARHPLAPPWGMTPNAAKLAQLEHTAAAELGPLIEAAKGYVRSAKADNTRRAYANDWKFFEAWCMTQGVSAMPCPPELVALYAAHLASRGSRVSTIERALVSICAAHKIGGHRSPREHPLVSETMKGIKRKLGVARRQKAPAIIERVRALVGTLEPTLAGTRDRAVITVGFGGGFRRSELVSLDVEDVAFVIDGLELTLRKSKTDQQGEGVKIGVPYGSNPATCPVRSLRAWLDFAGIKGGPVFRAVDKHGHVSPHRLGDRAVARIVQRCAAAAGLDERDYAAHSLRAGIVTQATIMGKPERAIMDHVRQKSVSTHRLYVRDLGIWRENAAAGIGL